ncbi:diacylglycerol O-acyltransferase [Microtetraspora sp. NBRC 13810]|uniref:WS/DGAT/MGAT family O-acyltransferase n=1 Tax=Microtetraspora sp. NBRC 13810 TaxID=3030990 RepID=UPI0024A43567|nr:wax ester/triacylglycerol synthase family O-acyltransferase [Microtetraspora sp. NBRC 13810]GLW11767.1 diacylglycerol O-acyltransferase [Microtetraspora sp. NBRC 13810]
MRQLTALDAQFLHAESPTTAAHVAGVAVLDPACASGAVTRDALVVLLRRRLHRAPALRMRLADVPLRLDHPYWTEDRDFDPDDHVYEVTLANPDLLAEEVGRIHARRLDRRRPLWEMHLIHGLAGGRVALYSKVHHCAIDGVSGAETLAALLDLSPEPPEPSRRAAARPAGPAQVTAPVTAPGSLAMLAGAAVRSAAHPLHALGSLCRTVADLDALPLTSGLPGARLVAKATRMLTGDTRPMPDLPALHVPRTPFNGPISAERRFAYGSLPLAEIKRVAKAFGISLNDVVMTLCASALRGWLRENDALPDRPLVAGVPVAVRTAGASTVVGNQLSAMVAPMATDVACPRERLLATGAAMRAAKRRFASSPATWLSELSSLLPAAVTALATAPVFRLASVAFPPVNLIVSNVPGPQFPLYLGGARVEAYYPISVLTDVSGGVNITCFSYDGSLDFGIVACPQRMADVWRLFEHLREAMSELSGLSELSEPPEPPELSEPPGAGVASRRPAAPVVEVPAPAEAQAASVAPPAKAARAKVPA